MDPTFPEPFELVLRGGQVVDPLQDMRGIADVSVLDDERGRLLRPLFCLRAGGRYDADSVILPRPVKADAA